MREIFLHVSFLCVCVCVCLCLYIIFVCTAVVVSAVGGVSVASLVCV
jgi:hypothetical protein